MDLGIIANRTLPNYPSLGRRSVQTRWTLGRSGLIWKKIRRFAIMLVHEPRIVVIRFINWDLHDSLIMAQLAIRLRQRTCLLQWRLLVSILVYTAPRESVIQSKFIERGKLTYKIRNGAHSLGRPVSFSTIVLLSGSQLSTMLRSVFPRLLSFRTTYSFFGHRLWHSGLLSAGKSIFLSLFGAKSG